MRLLRYSGVTFLVSSMTVMLACPPPQVVDDDDGLPMTTTMTSATTTPPMETTTGEDDDDDGTTTDPGDGTTSSGETDTDTDTTGEPPPECNVGQACGNGCIEGTEQCDCGGDFCTPAGLGGAMCLGQTEVLPTGQIRYYTGGILNCNPASCQFDYLQCSFCGDENVNGMELCELGDDGPSCQALGMGTSTDPLPCAPNCLEWDTTCCADPPPKECL